MWLKYSLHSGLEIYFMLRKFGYKISNPKEKQQMSQGAYKAELKKKLKRKGEIMVASDAGTWEIKHNSKSLGPLWVEAVQYPVKESPYNNKWYFMMTLSQQEKVKLSKEDI